MVFNDSTLRQMALKKPLSVEELLNIPGVGEKKAARYGQEFLSVIEETTLAHGELKIKEQIKRPVFTGHCRQGGKWDAFLNKRELESLQFPEYMSLRTYTPISKNIISQPLKKCNC